MANRAVSVELTLKSEQYKAEVEASKLKTEELDHKVDELDRDINKIPADSAKAAAGLELMGAAAKQAGGNVDDLDKRTAKARDELDHFKKSTEEIGNVSIFDKLGKTSRDTDALHGIEKEVTGAIETGAEDAATSPSMMQIGGAIGAALAIPILAAVGGATLALAGTAVAGLGVLGAVMGNPDAFQAEWGIALRSVKKEFLDASTVFTGPTLDAIRTIGPMVQSWHIGDTFANAAKYVQPLVHGIEGFVTGIEHGIADMSDKAGPAVAVLANGLDELGTAAGSAMSSIANGAEGGAQALHDTLAVVSDLVAGFGLIVEGAEKAYSFIQDHPIEAGFATGGLSVGASAWANAVGNADEAGAHFGRTLADTKSAAEAAGHSFSTTGDDLTALAQKINATTLSSDRLAESMSVKILNTMMSLDQAALGFDSALLSVSSALAKNGRSLDEHTTKGIANRQAILGVVSANIAQYQANMNAGIAADDAAKAYDANTAALERQLRKAGYTQQAIDGLIGKYKNVPDKVNTDIAVNGLTDAINNLSTLLKQIAGIHDKSVTIGVTTTYKTVGHPNVGEGGTIPLKGAMAEGGEAQAGMYLVGERGPEIVRFGGGEHVYTAAQSRSMMAASRPTGGPSGGTLQLVYNGPTGGLDALHLSWLAEASRKGNLQIHAKSVLAA